MVAGCYIPTAVTAENARTVRANTATASAQPEIHIRPSFIIKFNPPDLKPGIENFNTLQRGNVCATDSTLLRTGYC